MATYKQIQDRVRSEAGFVPKTSWIADVKDANGIIRRKAHNRQSPERRLQPCPHRRRASIEDALRYFGMLR